MSLFSQSRKSVHRAHRRVVLSLEPLEDRCCPVSSTGVANMQGTLSGNFLNNGETLVFSNAQFSGTNTFRGQFTGQTIAVAPAGQYRCIGTDNGQQDTFKSTSSNYGSTTGNNPDGSKNFYGWVTWTGVDNPDGDTLFGYVYFYGNMTAQGAVQNGTYFETIASEPEDVNGNFYIWNGGNANTNWNYNVNGSYKNWHLPNGMTPTQAPGNQDVVVF